VKFSFRQILASATGAVIAALILSTFGVNGTIIGVAIGSAAATIGTALVAQSIERGHEAVKQVVVRAPENSTLLRRLGGTGAAGRADATLAEVVAPTEAVQSAPAAAGAVDETVQMESPAAPGPPTERLEVRADVAAPPGEILEATTEPARRVGPTRRFSWPAIAGTAAVVFVLALGFITAIELISGKPLSSLFGGGDSGTTVNNLISPPPPTSTTTTTTTTVPSSTTTSTTGASTTTTTSPSGTTTSTTTPGSSTTTSTNATSTTTTTVGSGTTTTTSAGVGVTVP
jgi:hypothetical protein